MASWEKLSSQGKEPENILDEQEFARASGHVDPPKVDGIEPQANRGRLPQSYEEIKRLLWIENSVVHKRALEVERKSSRLYCTSRSSVCTNETRSITSWGPPVSSKACFSQQSRSPTCCTATTAGVHFSCRVGVSSRSLAFHRSSGTSGTWIRLSTPTKLP